MHALQLHRDYASHLLPLEEESLFSSLGDPPYSLQDILAKPMVLMVGQAQASLCNCSALQVGQYSTGKTSFIRALLGRDYPGMHIAGEEIQVVK